MAKPLPVLFQILCLILLFSLPVQAKQSIKLPKWKLYDFEFRSTVTSPNPFAVSFSADITGPNRIALQLPCFYDGNNRWKIRFSPTMEKVR